MATTTNYGWTMITPGGGVDTWGGTWNDNLGSTTGTLGIDAVIKSVADSVALKAPLADPTFTGTITGPTFVGGLTGDVTGDVFASNGTSKILESGTDGTDAVLTGNATSADKWSTARTVTLTGVVTGSVAFDGTGDFTLDTGVGTIADNTLSIAQTNGLQAALDSKVAHASGNGRTITVGNTAPTSPLTDDIWFDTTA